MDQTLDSLVGQVHAVAEVDVMQVLAELRDGEDSLVGNVAALCKDEISKTRSGSDDLLDSMVGDPGAGCEVEDAEVVKNHSRGKREEGAVIHELTHCQPEFSKGISLCEEIGNRSVANQLALVQVNLEDVGAVLGEGKDGLVGHLAAVVQFEPLEIPAVLGEEDQGLVGDFRAVGDVKALQALAVLGNDLDGLLGDLLVARDVEGHEVGAVRDERDQAAVGQALAVGEGQPLDAVADSQGHDAAVINSIGERGQVEAFDEIGIGVVGLGETESAADQTVLGPRGASRAVPEQVDGIPGPALACEHDMTQVCGSRQFCEYLDEYLVGQALHGGEALVFVGDLHVLQVGDAEGRLGVVAIVVEIRFLVLGRLRGARGGGRS